MDRWIYAAHALFWGAFLVRWIPRRAAAPAGGEGPRPVTRRRAAKHAGLVLLVHAIGFGCLYEGIGRVVFSGVHVARFFDLPWPIGAGVILLGGAVFAWALVVFDSWRVLAKLDEGHRLCTEGPYRQIRHPIYLACNLLAVGSFLWIPTAETLVGMIVMLAGAELRARSEEGLLLDVFGEAYRRYRETTKRYLPGIY